MLRNRFPRRLFYMEWFNKMNSDWEASSKAGSTEELPSEVKFPEGKIYSKELVCQPIASAGEGIGVDKWSVD